MKFWECAHTPTKTAECDQLAKKVLIAGSRCWRVGHHVCEGPMVIVDMAIHRWEALVKHLFPPGPLRCALRASRVAVSFVLSEPAAPTVDAADAVLLDLLDEPVEPRPTQVVSLMAFIILHSAAPWSADFQLVRQTGDVKDDELMETGFVADLYEATKYELFGQMATDGKIDWEWSCGFWEIVDTNNPLPIFRIDYQRVRKLFDSPSGFMHDFWSGRPNELEIDRFMKSLCLTSFLEPFDP